MILWKSKEKPETRGDELPCTAFRWVLEARRWKTGVGIGFVHQHKLRSTGEWRSSHTLTYEMNIMTPFYFGISHDYYDGPHCGLSLGYLRFNWCGDPRTHWCKKCMPDDDE